MLRSEQPVEQATAAPAGESATDTTPSRERPIQSPSCTVAGGGRGVADRPGHLAGTTRAAEAAMASSLSSTPAPGS